MLDFNKRKLPAGIQSFKVIRTENYLYVDKSDIIWYLANCGKKFNYLSRPRRFGKSVLVDTLQMYFEGRKDLFEGLKIMQLEKDWKQHPVIRLDLSRGGANAETLRSYLNLRFKEYEKKYAITPDPTAQLADRFNYAQMGMGQIDEAMKTLKALIADVPYSNKKLASMDMEERYRLIISTIFNAIGLKVEVEHMMATGRIGMTVQTSRFIYVIELKLRNNGGKDAASQQILDRQYMEPFKADKRQVIGLGIELDEEGKGLLDWKVGINFSYTPLYDIFYRN